MKKQAQQIIEKTIEMNKSSSDKSREKRYARISAARDMIIAPRIFSNVAEAQIGSTSSVAVYTISIYPSGKYHCTCQGFQRDAAHRQQRPCLHASAFASWIARAS